MTLSQILEKRKSVKAARKANRRERAAMANVLWPSAVEIYFGISRPTRWRWEREGKLPKRDVVVGTRTGWNRQTIVAASQSAA